MTDVSAVILAGGQSRRMGVNKAELAYCGMTLVEHQVRKMRTLGIDDIVISGFDADIEGTAFAADVYSAKGPLAGIHAGLMIAKNPHCLVISVDAPLVPEKALKELISVHIRDKNRITIISHGDEIEPLMGVYEKSLAGQADMILRTDDTSVRVLFDKAGFGTLEYSGDEELLFNCNTPDEYRKLIYESS